MPTILLKKSDTPGSVPGTANLTNLAGGVEVAVNTADKRVYSMTSASAVIELGTNPSSLTCADVSATVFRSASATITNLIATSASITTLTNNPTFGAGTANGVLYLNGSKVATSGTALVFDGTNLGIGTSSPAYPLQVRRAGGAGSLGVSIDSVGSISRAVQYFSVGDATNVTAGHVWYYRPATATDTVGMVLNGDGNLGIGTTSPAAKFETFNSAVNAAFVPNTASTWRVAQIRNDGTGTAGSAAGIAFVGRTDVQPAGIAAIQSTTGGGNTSLSFMYVGSNTTTEGMRLDNSGNLGLGVTPSLWNSDYKALNIGSKGIVYGRVGSQETAIGTNWYRTTAAAFVYASNGFATFYAQDSGNHTWHIAPNNLSGAAAPASFTQAMTLDASGNLLVGGTSGGNRLVVSNTTDISMSSGAAGQARFEGNGYSFAIAMNADGAALYTNSAARGIIFGTDETERGRFSAGGDFYVGGMASANGRLSVRGPGTTTGYSFEAANSAGSTRFLVSDNGLIQFYKSDNGEAARFTSGGDLLVGTTVTTAGARLDVKGVDSTGVNYCVFFENSGGNLLLAVQNDGRWRSGTSAASPYNFVVGSTNRDLFVDNSGDIGYVSSVRASKTNITPDVDTDWLLQLNPVTFNFRKRDEEGNYTDEADGPIKHGLIAEEVEEVNVDLCFYDDEDKGGALRGVNYSHLITPMLKLIQKQQAAIAALEADMAALKGAK
jgi:hypothetical protein